MSCRLDSFTKADHYFGYNDIYIPYQLVQDFLQQYDQFDDFAGLILIAQPAFRPFFGDKCRFYTATGFKDSFKMFNFTAATNSSPNPDHTYLLGL